MKIVLHACEAEELVKKSRFIGIIFPCGNERETLSILKRLHEQHPNANHIAYAYRIQSPEGLICRFHDAGEPSGTAGKPIFQHLEGKQLIDLIVVVIRYFGGIKLGAGGLTRAYGNIAKKVIETAALVDYIEFSELQLTLNYSKLQVLEYHLKKLDGTILSQNFSENVSVRIKIPKDQVDALMNAFE